eukprot:gene44217-54965_t
MDAASERWLSGVKTLLAEHSDWLVPVETRGEGVVQSIVSIAIRVPTSVSEGLERTRFLSTDELKEFHRLMTVSVTPPEGVDDKTSDALKSRVMLGQPVKLCNEQPSVDGADVAPSAVVRIALGVDMLLASLEEGEGSGVSGGYLKVWNGDATTVTKIAALAKHWLIFKPPVTAAVKAPVAAKVAPSLQSPSGSVSSVKSGAASAVSVGAAAVEAVVSPPPTLSSVLHHISDMTHSLQDSLNHSVASRMEMIDGQVCGHGDVEDGAIGTTDTIVEPTSSQVSTISAMLQSRYNNNNSTHIADDVA